MKLTKTLFERTEFTVLTFIFLIGLFLSLATNTFLTFNNLMNILLDISGIAIASIGITMVIITGGIDVSTGAILGVTAFFVGKLVETGANPVITVFVAIVVGALLGSINGALVSYGNIPPIITTLGTMNIYRAATFTLLQGKWINLLQAPQTITPIGLGRVSGIPVPFLIALVLITIASYFLYKRATGRYIYAIGGGLEAARLAGININSVRVFIYGLTGVVVAMSSVIYVARTKIVQANTGSGFELDVIAATVLGGTSILGGKGSVVGSLLGALLVGMIKNGLTLMSRHISGFMEGMVVGTLIIVMVLIDIYRKKRTVN
ncbi:inner-membrane translocator [Candidatus Vecturithrix granuli]|uniref:Inner-membrane translocator n=1 Tax=Vecturithrix granuli TaxID=1499967 RepID=A0A081C3X4_VECG1|nr:inner-membrane translocator [Candidatus Vecturithrix granuli]